MAARPRIRKKSKVTVGLLGRRLNLMCDVEGGPAPRAYWKRDGEDIETSDRVEVSSARVELEVKQTQDWG